MTDRFRIGQLANRCGVSRDTIRFYERAGLLPKPRRTATRHRVYDQDTAHEIRFIRRTQELGLTLDDIRQLIEVRDSAGGSLNARRVEEILRTRLDSISERIASFEKYRDRLREAMSQPPGGILQFLEPETDDNRSIREA